MSNSTVFFGYISFLREKVDAAMEIMTRRPNDYLWFCFNPSRMVQDGPGEAYPNMSFSIILDTDDEDDIIRDMEDVIRQLPYLSCTLVVENREQGTSRVLKFDTKESSAVR